MNGDNINYKVTTDCISSISINSDTVIVNIMKKSKQYNNDTHDAKAILLFVCSVCEGLCFSGLFERLSDKVVNGLQTTTSSRKAPEVTE